MLRRFIYLCFTLSIIFGCTQEKEYVSGNSEMKFKRVPFKELLNEKIFNNAYQKVKQEKQNRIASRSAIEDLYNFTIVEGKDVKIVEVDNKTFYNILIEKDSVGANYFKNLLIMTEKINNQDEVSAFLM